MYPAVKLGGDWLLSFCHRPSLYLPFPVLYPAVTTLAELPLNSGGEWGERKGEFKHRGDVDEVWRPVKVTLTLTEWRHWRQINKIYMTPSDPHSALIISGELQTRLSLLQKKAKDVHTNSASFYKYRVPQHLVLKTMNTKRYSINISCNEVFTKSQ